jgi:magnesium-transporting ATPase (P-type)
MKFNHHHCNYVYTSCSLLSVIKIILLFLSIAFLSLSSSPWVIAAVSDDGNNNDLLDKRNVAEIFDFGTGIFAAILFALSLVAYRNLRSKRLLFVSGAFGIFAIRTIVSRLDLFMPEIESSILESFLAVMSFAALALFFLAIVKREKIKTKSMQT